MEWVSTIPVISFYWEGVFWCVSETLIACVTYKMSQIGAPFSSVGRAGVPCTETLSLLQQPWVWDLGLFPVVSSAVLSIKPYKGQENTWKCHKYTFHSNKEVYSTCSVGGAPMQYKHKEEIFGNGLDLKWPRCVFCRLFVSLRMRA